VLDTFLTWFITRGSRILVIAALAYVVTRITRAAARRVEHQIKTGTGLDVIERTKRAQTLARIIQKTLSVLVTSMAGLMILREFDLDITPVLTGAGVAGVAVGFGAQTLVRDVISGFFLILEDQIRVGDVAVVNGQGGLVEEINLRTIVLRDFEGTVHVFPNGEVKTIANKSKDYAYYVLDVSVDYGADVDRVANVLREAASTMMDDPSFRPHILEPIEIVGVDAFGTTGLVLKARIKTAPLKQWDVGRELRKRVARLFAERGITMPSPQMNVRVEGLDDIFPKLPPPSRS
jgi:small conductance mechanosensitive channel